MSRLRSNLSSQYIAAANRLDASRTGRRVMAFVESFDDVLYWSQLLRPLERDGLHFEVVLPSRTSLSKGKKVAMANDLGPEMIACVDADYDYLMQGSTEQSERLCGDPWVFHTYAYAIENLQCYAPALQGVCVMAALSDESLFPFEQFLADYSRTIWPLLVWNVWAYRYGFYKQFSLSDLARVVAIEEINFHHPEQTIEQLRRRVNAKVSRLQRTFPEGRATYKPLQESLLRLGLTPETSYLYMRGHDLMDGVVVPLLTAVCERLRRDRENEIHRLAVHQLQMQNELSAYRHAISPVDEMMRKHTLYTQCPLYQRTQRDVQQAFFPEQQAEEGI